MSTVYIKLYVKKNPPDRNDSQQNDSHESIKTLAFYKKCWKDRDKVEKE